MELPGHRIESVLCDGPDTIVCRGFGPSGDRVILVTPTRERPSPLDVARIQRAFDLAPAAAAGAVVRPLDLVRHRSSITLVAENFDGVLLDALVPHGGFQLASLLATSHALSTLLARLHASGLLLNDFNPRNVLVDPASFDVRLLSLGLATRLSREGDPSTASAALHGPLEYAAPEHCRRLLETAIDDRADLYSFGVTLFHLAAGAPPFRQKDPAALAHAHVAVPPPDLQALRRDVPAAFCEIVMRLLRKNAEDRYASAAGVAHDLGECLSSFHQTGTIRSFVLGARDVSPLFRIPAKLYGRAAHSGRFHEAFEECRRGRRTVMQVAGPSGTGKTAFVESMQEPVEAAGGLLVQGKFEEFQSARPYVGVIKAFRQLLRGVLAMPQLALNAWTAALKEAMGVHGALLAGALPELVTLLGPQPDVDEAPPLEAARRSHALVGRFLKVFATPDRPLVLFLDDLQWSDTASINLLEGLAAVQDIGHLLLVLGYRSNELSSGHPARAALHALAGAASNDVVIEIGPLEKDDVTLMVAETLRVHPADAAPVAAYVHAVATGNVFFARELLISLRKRGFFRFNDQTRRWEWNLHDVARYAMPDTVAALLAERLAQMPDGCLDLLCTASCIGSEFDLKTVSSVHEISQADAATRLAPAVQGGLVVPLDANHEVLQALRSWSQDGELAHGSTTARYRFQHDQVNLTVHDQQDDEQRRRRHLHIGKLLFQTLSPEELAARAVAVFSHLSYGVDLVTDGQERIAYAELGLEAGLMAQRGQAFESARALLKAAASLLPEEAWEHHSALALGIKLELAKSAFALERTEELESAIADLLRNVRDPVDAAGAYGLLIRVRTTQTRYSEAVDSVVRIANSLGVRLPRKPSLAHVLLGVIQTLWATRRDDPMAFANRPEATDPRVRAAIDLLSQSANAAYFSEPNLLPLIAATCTRLSLRHGMAPSSAYGIAAWGLVLCSLGRIDTGYRFGELALAAGHRYGGFQEARARFVFICHIKHWKDPLVETAREMRRAFAFNRDTGDEESAVYCAGNSVYIGFLSGSSLDADRLVDGMVEYIASSNKPHVKHSFLAWVQLHEALRADELPDDLAGRWFDLARERPEFERTENRVQLAISLVASGVLDHLAGRFERAQSRFDEAAQCERYIAGQVLVPALALFRALNAHRLLAQGTSRRGLRRVARREAARLRRWEKFAPSNLAHRVSLLAAEEHQARGRTGDAILALHRAIDQASDGVVFYQALAETRLAEIMAAAGAPAEAQAAAERARARFQEWGAPALARRHAAGTALPPALAVRTSASASFEEIDRQSLLEATRAISSEIDEDALLERLMMKVMQTAGADRSLFVSTDGAGHTIVQAVSTVAAGYERPRVPLEEFPDLSRPVADLALRAGERVLVDVAQADHLLANDAYTRRSGVRSLLASCIKVQNRTVGVLYLENHVADWAFTPSRIEITEALGAQAGITLDNARLYQDVRNALRQQTVLTEANRRFVPQQLVAGLGCSSIVDIQLNEATEQEMHVLFADLRSFTTLARELGPRTTVRMINRYLSHVQPGIAAHRGFVGQYYGDGMLALFPDTASDAMYAAVAMCRGLEAYNRERGDLPALQFGIGIHSGPVIMGTIGDPDHFQCGVVGDGVNVAARVQGVTKHFAATLLTSGETVGRLEPSARLLRRHVGTVLVPGRSENLDVWESLDAYPEATRAALVGTLSLFDDARRAYAEGRWADACELFERCVAACPEDAVSRAYRQRSLRRREESGPWDGVERLEKAVG